jgi:nucleoside-diphosphate-sugar epimerase
MASIPGNEKVKGEAYNVSGAEVTTIVGVVQLIAKAMGVAPRIVEVPMALARKQRPPLMHWGEALTGSAILSIDKALRDIEWTPRFGIEDGYRDAYQWYQKEGRALYRFDFAAEDKLLAELGL